MAATIARDLYSAGEAEKADALLTEFAKLHPDATESINFRHCWFNVALLGLGDRVRAKAFLAGLEATGANIQSAAKTDPIFSMYDAYYSRLTLTDDELKRNAFAKMKTIRAKR